MPGKGGQVTTGPRPDGDQKATAVPATVSEPVRQEPAEPEPEPAEPEMTEARPLDPRPYAGRYAHDPVMMAGRDGQAPRVDISRTYPHRPSA